MKDYYEVKTYTPTETIDIGRVIYTFKLGDEHAIG